MRQQTNIVEANLDLAEHQQAVRALTAAYAQDPMGNGGPLPAESLEMLIDGLRNHLAYLDGDAVGIATCFRGFSTFFAKPLLNIHDIAVLPDKRGRGIGRELLEAVERKAQGIGCCKVTLEVQENNTRARRVYERAGFSQAVYGDTTGGSLFYTKPLASE